LFSASLRTCGARVFRLLNTRNAGDEGEVEHERRQRKVRGASGEEMFAV